MTRSLLPERTALARLCTVDSRLDRVRQAVSDSLVPLDLKPAGGPGAVRDRFVTSDLGAVRVAELTTFGPDIAERTPRLIKQRDPGLVKIDVLVRGQVMVEQGGRQARLFPGDLAFVDLSRPCRWVNSGGRIVAVSFSRTLLPLHQDRVAGLTGTRIPGHGGAGALVSSFVRQLPRHIDDGDVAGHARLGTAVLDLVAGTLAARLGRADLVPRDSRQRALLIRIHAFIERELGNLDLTPAGIAAAHHVSVRHLYQLFAAQKTTVAGWIRDRRLERSHKDLLDPALRGRTVSTIAARWGLTNPAHFSRLFRAAYGLPPAEYRRIHDGSDRLHNE